MAEATENLEELIELGDAVQLEEHLDTLSPVETARAISDLSDDERARILNLLDAEAAAEVLEDLPDPLAADLLEDVAPRTAAAIVNELDSDEAVDVLADVESAAAEAILCSMSEEDAAAARALLEYPEESAGGLMSTDFLSFRDSLTVGDVVFDLRAKVRAYEDFHLQYLYVMDREQRLSGVLRMRDLVIHPPERPVVEVMIADPASARVDMDLPRLLDFFDENEFIGLPVVDEENRLLGVVLREDVEETAAEQAQEDLLKHSGIAGGEELRSMPLRERSARRLGWLSVNILLNMAGAGIISYFSGTLQEVIALAIFLPMISDMSGCSGNQAVAVSIRELSIGLANPGDLLRVFRKELCVGLVNGVVLGALLTLLALVWKGNVWLGLVVGCSLALNTVLAVCLGGTLPLVLKRFGKDPALASGPILTTLTDMCGFLLVFTFASLALARLAGA